ncbi:MAG: cell division protein FtsL [Pseudomonadota bacterium]
MKTFIFGLIAMAVMGLAVWAYHQNYQTTAALKETEALQDEIAQLRIRVGVLRAEWAYLNRPERLRDLADLNFDRLGLFALAPEQFGHVDEVAFPGLPADNIARAVDARGTLEDSQ